MGLVIPSSSTKRYLSGFDWVMCIVDHIMRSNTSSGNVSQIVFVLDSPLDQSALRTNLSEFIKQFPVLYGRVSRDYNLAPYWRMPSRETEKELDLNVYQLENSATDIISLLEKCVNKPFKDKNDHLAFHMVYTQSGPDYLGVTFDHLLFDARGIELFIDLFQQYLLNNNDPGIGKEIRFSAPAHLSQWMDKFDAGKQVNRRLIALKETSARVLPTHSSPEKTKGFKYKFTTFTQSETENIINSAYDEAGYLMEMPYFLAIALQAIHELFEKRGVATSDYFIPVSVDKRSGKDLKQEIFFNYASMFLFKIGTDILDDRKTLITSIKAQMYEQAKSQFLENIWKASLLLRIAPLPVLGKLFYLPSIGERCSFLFSYVGKRSYQYPDLMGAEIVNLLLMPRIPFPPGFGVFFNVFGGKLSATITWFDGLLTDEEVGCLGQWIESRLK